MKKRIKAGQLGPVIDKLTWALPFALAARHAQMTACYHMSFATSEVLKRLGYEATPLPCSLLCQPPDRSFVHCLGLNGEELRARGAGGEVTDATSGQGHHVIVEVRHRGARVVLDPTLGQLRKHGIPMAFSGWWFSRDWPAVETEEGWFLQYEPSPRHDDALAVVARLAPTLQNLVDDLAELTDVARRSSDTDRFLQTLQAMSPDTYRRSWAIIQRWMELGPVFDQQ